MPQTSQWSFLKDAAKSGVAIVNRVDGDVEITFGDRTERCGWRRWLDATMLARR
jgi:hypothetical protein